MRIKHKIKVENGKFKFLNPDLFKIDLKKYEGQEAIIVLSKNRLSRSDNQNKYYWGVVLKVLCDETGQDKDNLHDWLAYKFLGGSVFEFNKESVPTIPRTSKLNTAQFEDYLNRIRVWASSDLQIYIPLPNEYDYIE